jgi:hypothetical protein
MTLKRATTNDAHPTPAQTSPNEIALFLETTAQFYRIAGPPSIQETIQELIDRSDKVGTSAHVKREFDYVYGGFFKSVIFNVRRLPNQSRPQNLARMWLDVFHLMPKHFPGGPYLFLSLGMLLIERLGNKLMTPTELINVLEAYRESLLGRFHRGDFFFDKSTCGVWDKPCSCQCGSEPRDACRLKEICVTMRSDFLASAKTLAGKGREESKWLKENLDLLEALHGKALMELLGKHPGHVGDPVIFWETPDSWTILTRDLTFRILQKAHRDQGMHRDAIKVHILRLPREASGGKCTVLPEAAVEEVDGVLIDYNAQGARVRAPAVSVKRRQRVTIKAREFGSNGAGENSREGRVAYLDKEDTSVFAVRFPSK